MKKLLILTAVLMLAGSSAGCRCWQGWWRGAYNPCPPAAVYAAPAPACNPCDPCGGAPVVSPGATYVPGPG